MAFFHANIPWLIALAVALVLGMQVERAGRRPWRPRFVRPATPEPPAFDAAQQLRCVERSTFTARRVLNRGETRLFGVLERACAAEAPGWRVMAQVSLGEILASPDATAYRAINTKRVDLLLVGADGMPLHAIELQGTGHHLGPAATRDAIKKEALRKAGIGYVEIVPGDTPAEVRGLVAKLAMSRLAPA